MLGKKVKATRELVNLNKCLRAIQPGEIGIVTKSVENERGFQLLVKFAELNPMAMVHFKADSNRNKLEIL